MKLKLIAGAGVIMLTACATVVDEQRSPRALSSGYYAGEPYEVVTQTVQGNSGTFDRSFVLYRGKTSVCRADSAGDCEKAARRLIDERFSSRGDST